MKTLITTAVLFIGLAWSRGLRHLVTPRNSNQLQNSPKFITVGGRGHPTQSTNKGRESGDQWRVTMIRNKGTGFMGYSAPASSLESTGSPLLFQNFS